MFQTLTATADGPIGHLTLARPDQLNSLSVETLEEIGIRAREQWAELGGEALELIPCVNAEPAWVRGVAGRIRSAAPTSGA